MVRIAHVLVVELPVARNPLAEIPKHTRLSLPDQAIDLSAGHRPKVVEQRFSIVMEGAENHRAVGGYPHSTQAMAFLIEANGQLYRPRRVHKRYMANIFWMM